MDAILITGLRALGTHGVLPEERARAQPFEVDLEIRMDLRAAGGSDALSDTFDYAEVSSAVVAIVEAGGCALLEALAEHIATAARAHPGVDSVVVTVRKLRPPVALHMRDVSVRIERPPGEEASGWGRGPQPHRDEPPGEEP